MLHDYIARNFPCIFGCIEFKAAVGPTVETRRLQRINTVGPVTVALFPFACVFQFYNFVFVGHFINLYSFDGYGEGAGVFPYFPFDRICSGRARQCSGTGCGRAVEECRLDFGHGGCDATGNSSCVGCGIDVSGKFYGHTVDGESRHLYLTDTEQSERPLFFVYGSIFLGGDFQAYGRGRIGGRGRNRISPVAVIRYGDICTFGIAGGNRKVGRDGFDTECCCFVISRGNVYKPVGGRTLFHGETVDGNIFYHGDVRRVFFQTRSLIVADKTAAVICECKRDFFYTGLHLAGKQNGRWGIACVFCNFINSVYFFCTCIFIGNDDIHFSGVEAIEIERHVVHTSFCIDERVSGSPAICYETDIVVVIFGSRSVICSFG